MGDRIRWGILGAGNIAGKFAKGLGALPDAELVAVGSRDRERAERFASEHGVPRAYDGYDALVADGKIDVVYVATRHPDHMSGTLLCLDAGKPVLCEKPFALNERQARVMTDRAREKKLFLMEALWSQFFPATAKMMELLRAGAVGEVRLVTGSFGYRAGFDPKSRLFDRSLGGGALLDVGIYTIWLAHTVFAGEPERVLSMADIGKTGVDEQSAMILGYPRGAMALLVAAVRAETQQEGAIYGTDGRMRLGPPFWQPDAVVLSAGDREETFSFKREGNGYNYQAAEVMRCLREGRTESDFMPHSKTLAMMRTLDRARAPWGLVYPGE